MVEHAAAVDPDPTRSSGLEDQPVLEATGIIKSFGGGRPAVDGVSLTVRSGTVHALVGENGAGKSTLSKIISGVVRPDAGSLRMGAEDVEFHRPSDALRAGITIMQQELSLATDMTVEENVLLGGYPSRLGVLSRRRLRTQFRELCAKTGFDLDGEDLVGSLPLAKQQEVEILRALGRDARVIIMDEPTAALSAREIPRLHAVVRSLRESGIAVIYISHFLEEVLALSDEITVMRNGRRISTVSAASSTVSGLVAEMVGDRSGDIFPARPPLAADAPVALRVRNLRRSGQKAGVDLTVRAGEIVGLFGLVGAGRSELAQALFGAEKGASGEVEVHGVPANRSSPARALRSGLALLPESRKDQGLFLGMRQRENTTISNLSRFSRAGTVRRGLERQAALAQLKSMKVDPPSLEGEVGHLSGGNQQKVLFAKTLLRRPRILILDEPTRGVDVGARRAIYDILVDLARDGMALIVISSEYEEAAHMSHRLLVMRGGALVAEFDSHNVSHDQALAAAFGVPVTSTELGEMV